MHNSTCTNQYETNSFDCNCTLGYEGKYCEVEINECRPLPCKNGGNCTDLVRNFMLSKILVNQGSVNKSNRTHKIK